jgi:hypothetical protein
LRYVLGDNDRPAWWWIPPRPGWQIARASL